MDPLPPPTTVTTRSLELRQRASRSRSATASQASSRSASAVPDEPREGSPPHSEIGDDQSTPALSRQSTLNDIVAPQRLHIGDIDDASVSTIGRPPSPAASVAGDDRPRKRRKLNRGPVRNAHSTPNVLHRTGDHGPSASTSTSNSTSTTRPPSTASSPRRSGPPAAHSPIDVDALPDPPARVPADPVAAAAAAAAVPTADKAEGSSQQGPAQEPPPQIDPDDEDGAAFPQVLSPSDPGPPPSRKHPEPLSAYVCPICLSPPTYPTVTPCGHVCCSECLFSAVRSTIERSAYHGPMSQRAK